MSTPAVVSIAARSSVSALGISNPEIWQSYLRGSSLIRDTEIGDLIAPVSSLSESGEIALEQLLGSKPNLRKLDRVSQLAVLSALNLEPQKLLADLRGSSGLVCIGSSRGATSLFESAYSDFLNKNSVPVLSSPTTTLGNLSSSVLHALELSGFASSGSVTCSTALQAVINAIAWLKSGMADFAIAGGAEAPLTAFTISQMKALRIYADTGSSQTACMPLAAEYSGNAGMVLGEGAATVLLQLSDYASLDAGEIYIAGFGYSSEAISNLTSISETGAALRQAMEMAIASSPAQSGPDAVLCHAPGTASGDKAELAAIHQVFSPQHGRTLPLILSNKWIIGHTLGAAAAFNLDYACHILEQQNYIDFPYATNFTRTKPKRIKSVMLNATGFGGNAASIIIAMKE